MASLSRLRGKYYARVYLRKDGRYKEKLISLHTDDEYIAKDRIKEVQRQEKKIKRGLAEDLSIFKKKHPLKPLNKRYIRECKSRLSPRTVTVYETALALLCKALPNHHIEDFQKSDYNTILNFLKTSYNLTSVNIYLRAIKTFLLWTIERDYLSRMPLTIKQVSLEKSLPKFFSPAELGKIYKQILDSKNEELYSIIKVYENTGMRLRELFNSRRVGNYIHISKTKGKKERIVPLPEEILADFEIARKTKHGASWITHKFSKACTDAAIAPGKSLHSLRHTYALKSLLKYGNAYIVKELLGHTNVATTEIYLKFPIDYLKQVFEQKDNLEKTPELLDQVPIKRTPQQIHTVPAEASA
ncbi:site-specific integrase [Patescibacteria group bacterium]|nr:site-specific integrase [Patescibacteria group bacterium]